MPPIPESRSLAEALVAAYEPYVRATVNELGPVPAGLDDALAAGTAWLEAELGSLLSLPFDAQPRGPLEVFQEAMRFPTEVLEQAGAAPAERDPATAEALPGDVYDLAPASSQVLGEEVWAAHIAWGAAKAGAFRPFVGLLSRDLMDRSRIEPAVEGAGFTLTVWADAAAVAAPARPVAALVDLTHTDADEVIRMLTEDGVKVIAFGPHVDDIAMARARSLGAADALTRSVFFRNPAAVLPTLV